MGVEQYNEQTHKKEEKQDLSSSMQDREKWVYV